MRQSSFIEKGVTTSHVHIQIMAFAMKEVVLLFVWCCLTYSNVQGNLLLFFLHVCMALNYQLPSTMGLQIADAAKAR